MPFSTIAQVENAFKTIFIGPIINQLDIGTGPILATIKKSVMPVSGNEFKFPLSYGRSGGIGARGESDDLPDASPRKYIQGAATPKNIYARIALSVKLILSAKQSRASFADQVSLQMEDITNDAMDMLRRNLVGKADGVMGKVNANVTGAKDVVVKDGNILYFYTGQFVDILTDSSGTVTKSVDKKEIGDVDYSTNTITFKENVTVTANQLITLAGNYNNELIGLGDIFTADSEIFGINRANNKWFNPKVLDKSAATFDSIWMQEAIDMVQMFTGNAPNFIAMNQKTARAYKDEQDTYKTNIEYMKIDGGYDLMSYSRIPISPEKYMADGVIDFLNTKDFKYARLDDWNWMDYDGKILSRVPDKPAYEASLLCFQEMICNKIGGQARIKNFTTSA